MAVLSISSSNSLSRPEFQTLEKPRSLKIHEVAITVLKVAAFIFEIVSDFAMGFAVEGALFDDQAKGTIALIVFAVSTPLYWLAKLMEKRISSRLQKMETPGWIEYFSEAYRSRPIEDLMRDLPNRKVWHKLNWNGLLWKEKILPFAKAHQLDRKKNQRRIQFCF